MVNKRKRNNKSKPDSDLTLTTYKNTRTKNTNKNQNTQTVQKILKIHKKYKHSKSPKYKNKYDKTTEGEKQKPIFFLNKNSKT